jgi:muramoyltetrapeptide carboxypeptidase
VPAISNSSFRRPPALKSGSRVALVAAAGPLAPGAVDRAARRVEARGWLPVVGEHARGRHGFLAAPDEARLDDLNRALRDPEIDAIWLLRGGYGTMRLLERIDWEAARRRPRAVIGFSDNTAIHLALSRLGLVSFHGPHPAAEDFPDFSADLLTDILRGEPVGTLPAHPDEAPVVVRAGSAEGRLIGGNLALLSATLGTPYQVDATGAILAIEDVGEPPYRLDRLLTQLRLAGVLEGVAGVALGSFAECAGDADDPGLLDVFADRLGDLGVPVLAGLPFGHVPHNWTLPFGVRARLDADAGTLGLLEPAVER